MSSASATSAAASCCRANASSAARSRTPFIELSPLAGHGMYDDDVPAGGIITGIGQVMNQQCVIVVNDATVKGGTYYPITGKKHLPAQDIARENRRPASICSFRRRQLPNQDQVFLIAITSAASFQSGDAVGDGRAADCGGDGFVHRGRRFVPAMADESIIVINQGTIFLGPRW